MFKKILFLILIFNISLVYADSSIIDSKSEFDLGTYENTYYETDSVKINISTENIEDSNLLLHFDNGDESTTFVDSSNSVHIITANGNVKQENSKLKFGPSSGYFDGSSYLSIPDSEDWNFGSEDFTIDFWINFETFPISGYIAPVFTQFEGSYRPCFGLQNNDGIYSWRIESSSSPTNIYSKIPTTISLNTWYHIALIRNGENFSVYQNGNLIGNYINPGNWVNAGVPLTIGKYGTDHYLNGYIDELRITKGEALWIKDFTPPNQGYYPSLTKLLLHFDGPNQSQTHFYDYSDSKHSLTVYGNTKLDSSEKIFGESSAYFDGTGDYISIPDSDDWTFGSKDFTVDFWFKPTVNPSANPGSYAMLIDHWNRDVIADQNWYLTYNSDNTITFNARDNSGIIQIDFKSSNTLSLNQWHHVAIVKDHLNSKYYLFLDGIKTSISSSWEIVNGISPLIIGTEYKDAGDHINYFTGYLDEIRISKGIARWTEDFTPNDYQHYSGLNGLCQSHIFDMSSKVNWQNFSWFVNQFENLEVNNNTKLLLHFNNGDESTTFTDSSILEHSITANGNVKQENSKLKFGDSSAYFDGTGDYISIPDSEDWNFENEDFTIDFWYYPQNLSGYRGIIGQYDSSSSDNSILFLQNGNNIDFYWYTNGINGGAIPIAINLELNKWQHIAVVRTNSSLKGFVNGELNQNIVHTDMYHNSNLNFEIGRDDSVNNRGINGYVDEFRISKGIARWTKNFNPPNQEYYENPIKLLLHFDQGDESTTFIDSSNFEHSITASGNAKQENSEKRFGDSSAYFDGSGDYLTLEDSNDWYFETEDFTIDFWINFNSLSGHKYILTQGDSNNPQGWDLHYNSDSNGLRFSIAGTGIIISPNSFSINKWYHVALIREGTIFKFYVDGKLIGTSTSSSSISNVNYPLMIGRRGDGYYFNGYLDELRIIKGKAMWTKNFIPPNQEYYSNLNNFEMQYKTCSNSDCSDGTWQETTNGDLTGLSSQYFQFQSILSTSDMSYNPELFNVSLNYQNETIEEPTTPQYFVYPTPLNDSNLITNNVIINISSSSSLSNCILHINSQDIVMNNYGTYCSQNLTEFNLEISQYVYNVSFTENSENKFTENWVFTYYPDYSEEAMPSQGIISILISIIIILGGLLI